MNKLQQKVASAGFAKWVRKEHADLTKREETLNLQLRKQMLRSWELTRPKMYARLQAGGILEQTADVLQAKMWEAEKMYQEAGMARTDATEQAEREWLMLDPEDGESSQDGPDSPFQDNPQPHYSPA